MTLNYKSTSVDGGDKLYFNDTEVKKLYFGGKLVYEGMLRPGDILFEGNFIVPANYSTLELPSVKADWSNVNSTIKITSEVNSGTIISTISKEDLLGTHLFNGVNATITRGKDNTLSIHAIQYAWSIIKIELV